MRSHMGMGGGGGGIGKQYKKILQSRLTLEVSTKGWPHKGNDWSITLQFEPMYNDYLGELVQW